MSTPAERVVGRFLQDRVAAARDTLTVSDVVKLPVGSLVFQAKDGQLNGSALIVIPDHKLTQVALLPERANGESPGGEPVAEWGREFFLIQRGSGKLVTHGAAQRAAIKWHQAFLRGE